jgi:streptogramin lyase
MSSGVSHSGNATMAAAAGGATIGVFGLQALSSSPAEAAGTSQIAVNTPIMQSSLLAFSLNHGSFSFQILPYDFSHVNQIRFEQETLGIAGGH